MNLLTLHYRKLLQFHPFVSVDLKTKAPRIFQSMSGKFGPNRGRTAGHWEMICPKPFSVPPVEVHEVPGLHASGAGQPAAGGAAQGAPLHRHVQPLCVVHGLHHHTARAGLRQLAGTGADRRPPVGERPAG